MPITALAFRVLASRKSFIIHSFDWFSYPYPSEHDLIGTSYCIPKFGPLKHLMLLLPIPACGRFWLPVRSRREPVRTWASLTALGRFCETVGIRNLVVEF